MAGKLQTLNLHPPTTATPFLRSLHLQFPISRYSFPGGRISKPLVLRRYLTLPHTPSTTIRASNQKDDANKQLPQLKAEKWVTPFLKFSSNNFLPLNNDAGEICGCGGYQAWTLCWVLYCCGSSVGLECWAYIPSALVGGVALGLANPSLGCLADRYYLSKFSTFGVFVMSGLTLRSDAIGAAAEAWQVGLFGLGSILIFTPLFSKIRLLVKLQPQEFITGLAIFCCMPTTLSSRVALPQIPFSISKFIASVVGVSVPTEQLFRSLVLTLLLPLILGKVLREAFKTLADFSDRNRKLLSVLSAFLLSLVRH